LGESIITSGDGKTSDENCMAIGHFFPGIAQRR